ncbi:MAG: ABC transporter permease [Verrucomicrobia bacterium]|nr:ABC transporter permease [Verrucomicrobiota bacterium]
MSARPEIPPATARTEASGNRLTVILDGAWRITEARPTWPEILGSTRPERVQLRLADGVRWDSSLLLFLFAAQQWCREQGSYCDLDALPAKVRELLAELDRSHESSVPFDRTESFLTSVGVATENVAVQARGIFDFIGECVLSTVRLVRSPRKFRWGDCLNEMQQCGAMALPIVSLISFLVGVTLAYTGAIVLRQFGGDIYIADIIGLSMVREMGAVMTAVVLAGRTGAAFAAHLGNMKANEEIDALETLGIPPVQFLVLPRLLALCVMMPLLTLYANALGILGGGVVAYGLLSIPAAAYWIEMQTIVDASDIASGLIKAGAFGLIVGLAGCLRGLQAERSAAGVGRAATSAVVTALLMLVIADALFAVAFNKLGI